MEGIVKYPRTRHIEGSGLQKGDHDLKVAPFQDVRGRSLVVEEKVDGANAGVSFTPQGALRLQCRGHYLTGGPSEAQFALFKPWAETHRSWLWDVLGDRYILYGEWCLAKHTVFYDALPHYFLEFDIYDTATGDWLSTERRREMLAGRPVVSVPVLKEGTFSRLKDLTDLVRPSLYKTPRWRDALREAAEAAGTDPDVAATRETDRSDLAEGLYVKHEEDGRVVGRYKWVRPDFLNAILDSGSHWRDRPLVRNGLAPGADLFAL
jgi:hypothetical protein